MKKTDNKLAALDAVIDGVGPLQIENMRMRLALQQIRDITKTEASMVALKCHSWALTGLDEQVEWKVPS